MRENDIKAAAETYLDYFSMDFGPEGAKISLEDQLPKDLSDLLANLGSVDLAGVFECFSALAEADDVECMEFDEKVCPIDLMDRVKAGLRQ